MPRYLIKAVCRASIQERWTLEAPDAIAAEGYIDGDRADDVIFIGVEDEVLGEEEDRTIESIEEVSVAPAAPNPPVFGIMQQIEASAKIDDLDEAVRPIQDILGQDDGGLAAQFFDSEFDWKLLGEIGRKKLLIRYVVFEMGHMEFSL